MIRRFFFFLLFLFLFSQSLFAFINIESAYGNSGYFSLNDGSINIVSNSSIIFSNFSILNYSFSKNYSLVSCSSNSSNFCINLSINSFREDIGNSVSYPSEVLFYDNSSLKKIFFDFDKPSINYSVFFNATLKNIVFNYNFSDNSGDVRSFELFLKDVSGNLEFISSLINSSSFSYKVDKSGIYDFVFILKDRAGNVLEEDISFNVMDYFPPNLNNLFVYKEGNSFYLNGSFFDDSLLKGFLLTNGVYDFSGVFNSSSENLNLLIPFNSGILNLSVFDTFNNSFTMVIPLDNKISFSSFKKYVNSPKISFYSDADSCVLKNINLLNKNIKFNKNGNYFYLDDLEIQALEFINVKIFCKKGFFGENFDRVIFYDNKLPEEISLEYNLTDEGEILLKWTDSKDGETDRYFSLLRDGEKIYEGRDLSYLDDDVLWPNFYNYTIRVYDLAGNFNSDNMSRIQPKKNFINLELVGFSGEKEIDWNESIFNLDIRTDSNSKIFLIVYNNQSEYFSENRTSSEDIEGFKINLLEGVNEIRVMVLDNFSNSKSDSIFVKYFPTISSDEELKKDFNSLNNLQVLNNSKNNSISTNVLNESSKSLISDSERVPSFFYLLIFLILLLVLISIYYFFVDSSFYSSKKFSSKKNLRSNGASDFASNNFIKDSALKKNLKKLEERNKKKQEDSEKKKKLFSLKKNHDDLSDYEKEKLNDLKRKRVVIPFSVRNKSKRNYRGLKRLRDKVSNFYGNEKKEISSSRRNVSHKKKNQNKNLDLLNDFNNESRVRIKNNFSSFFSSLFSLKKISSNNGAADNRNDVNVEDDVGERANLETKIGDGASKNISKSGNSNKELKNEEDFLSKKISGDEYRRSRKNSNSIDLDSYLKSKSNKKKWFLTEREVDRDLRRRK